MRLTARATGLDVSYRDETWETGIVRAEELVIGGSRVVGTAGAAIADPAGGNTNDAGARSSLGEILSALRLHGLIQT